MNQNPFIPPVGGQTPEPYAGPLIRTMSKDIETLEKKPKEEVAFQSPGYEPPPEMPLGMAPPAGEPAGPITGGPPAEIPAPLDNFPPEAQSANDQSIPYQTPQIPETTAEMPPPPPPAGPQMTETVISEKALAEFAPPQPPKKDIKKMAVIAGITGLAVIFGLAGWFLYPKIFPASTPLPTPPIIIPTPDIQPPTPAPPTPSPSPTPLVFFLKTPEKTSVLDIIAQTKTELIAALKKETEQIETVGTLKIIDLRQDGVPITFSQFTNLMGLNIPTELASLILPEFILFVNSHAQEGSRLGLIVVVSDPTAAITSLKNWEATIDTDLRDLFLGADTGEKTEFRDGNYQGVAKRFLAFKPPFSIDYGIYQNFLIITTSRFSFANAIDHILGKEE